jgi:RNA polymerase sigma factor (sigma-70 family)
MPDRHIHALLRRLRQVAVPDAAVADAGLLERFVRDRDAAAFETLVWRHGPMVLGVCRRILRHEQDAEDVFQATFLALARKAAAIGRGEAVAGWLYRVACRAACRLKAGRHRRPVLDAEALETAPARPSPDPEWSDLRPVLDDEVNRLPRKYREAFVLCVLEGLTGPEAARQLGCPPATVLSRLSKARQRLRTRLARRGIGLTVAALAAAGAEGAAPGALVRVAVRAGCGCLAGQAPAAVLPAHVIQLTEGVLRTMCGTRLHLVLLVCLSALVLGAAGLCGYRDFAARAVPPEQTDKRPPDKPPAPPAKPADKPGPAKGLPAALEPASLLLVGHKGAVRAVAFGPDGKTVVTGGADGTLRIWDLATGTQTQKLEHGGEVVGLVFLGKELVAASEGNEGKVSAWDVDTGKVLRTYASPYPRRSGPAALACSPDGARIVVGQTRGFVAASDARSGALLFVFKLAAATAVAVASSPDGKLIAAGDDNGSLHLLDSASGRALRRFQVKGGITALVFFPDGDRLAAASGEKSVRLFDVNTGKETSGFGGDTPIRALALSPGGDNPRAIGKRLACAESDGTVRLWDPTTATEERRFGGPGSAVTALAFAADGKRLATVGPDGAVVWDLTQDAKPLPKDLKLTAKELDGLWADLGGTDGRKVYTAVRLLRADPERSIPFLRERLKQRPEGLDEKKVKKLIADLDADEFQVREAAAKELAKLGKSVESPLRAALAGSPSVEVKGRLERLLEAIGDETLTPEQQRDVRAVRVLEQTGTPEARKLLEELTGDSAGWWVIREAKAARERLDRRPPKP